MKIAHVGIAGPFTENMTYQDNMLTHQNVLDGHKVLYIANSFQFKDSLLVETGYEDIILSDGVRLVRLPYEHIFNHFVSEKFRKVKGLYKLLEDFQPNVIMSHDLSYWSVLNVIRYKKKHSDVKFYADTHTDEKNSGKNWLSLHILHRIFYRYLNQRALPYLEKYFYVTEERKTFAMRHYGIPEEILEFYPLGGTVLSDGEYAERRQRYRQSLGAGDMDQILIHSGKMDTLKRTEELLNAFSSVNNLQAKLLLIGSMSKEREPVLLPLIEKDSRIVYLGWKTAEDLMGYLCAGDLYLQPGSQSATLENALCCRCAVMSYPHEAYTVGYCGSGILWCKTQTEMEELFQKVAMGEVPLTKLCDVAFAFAKKNLDYKKLASRLYR